MQDTPRSSCDAEIKLTTFKCNKFGSLKHPEPHYIAVKKRGENVGKIFMIEKFTIKKAARARYLVDQLIIVMEQINRLFEAVWF